MFKIKIRRAVVDTMGVTKQSINFSYIINSNVWAGSDRDIVGPYHSNGGIRMDGFNHSVVSSSVEDWLCTSSFGCSPNQTKSGVWGSGSGSALWNYPLPQIDFAGISVDLSNIKNKAQLDGIYYGPYGNRNGRDGYHLIFRSDDTVDVYQVTNTWYTWGWHSSDQQWHRDYHRIRTENFIGRRIIPEDCPVIFIEDKVWLEGEVSRKVTLAVADLSLYSYNPDLILKDDITYTTSDGSVGLTAIAENSVSIPPQSPDTLNLRGIFKISAIILIISLNVTET